MSVDRSSPRRQGLDRTAAYACCLALALAAPLLSASSVPGPPSGEPDLLNGKDINEVCAGCHGDDGQGGKGGEYPRIAGLPFEYIYRQVKLFQQNRRPNLPMLEHVHERQLKDAEIRDISAYIAAIALPTRLEPMDEHDPRFDAFERMDALRRVVQIPVAPGDSESGRKLYDKECRSCHGKRGWGDKEKQIPQLAGQYTSYLWRQLDKLRNGVRIHDPEEPEDEMLKEFSHKELTDILGYLSIVDD